MKALNLYAGIGGNRKLWNKVTDIDVTAVEIKEEIASIYQDFFPQDEVVVADAHEYLKGHYREFDFIWSSPPCPTHSRIRNIAGVGRGQNKPVYPDMRLYQETIFLRQIFNSNGVNFNGRYCVENVNSYYKPLIKPQKAHRHYFWANFIISDVDYDGIIYGDRGREQLKKLQEYIGFSLEEYNIDIKRKVKLLRNCVHPKLGKHILECATTKQQKTIAEVMEADS